MRIRSPNDPERIAIFTQMKTQLGEASHAGHNEGFYERVLEVKCDFTVTRCYWKDQTVLDSQEASRYEPLVPGPI